MSIVSVYSLETGLFTGRTMSGAADFIAANTPDGFAVIEGSHARDRVRVDLATGEIVPYQPPAPDADEYQTWSWDADAWQWLSVPTTASLARDARAERTRRIDALTRRYERNAREARLGRPLTDSLAALDAYAQALADLPTTPGFPSTINWPQEPA